MEILNFIIMVIVGAFCGTLAAKIMKGGRHFGFLINAILGIAGAVVAGSVYNFLDITPGANLVKILSNTFGVNLPVNIVGMFVSSTLGAILILWLVGVLNGKRRRRRRKD